MAVRDDASVKREEFLAALKTLEPLPPGEESPAGVDSGDTIFSEHGDPGADQEEGRAGVMAEIARGVQSEAEKGKSRKGAAGARAVEIEPLPDEGGGEAERGTVTALGGGAVEAGSAGPTFEELVRQVLADELRRWVDQNLEAVTERVVRDEIRMMGRRPPRGED